MTLEQQIIIVLLCVAATMLTRFLPFLIFSEKRPLPAWADYLGHSLPLALFALLVVYSLRDVSLVGGSHGIPEAIAILAIWGLHKWKHNMLLSIAGGTILYMMLVQIVF